MVIERLTDERRIVKRELTDLNAVVPESVGLAPGYRGEEWLERLRAAQRPYAIADRPLKLLNGATLDGGTAETFTLPAADQYQLMAESFSRAVRGEAPLVYGLDDARANMHIIDALFRSETSGQWESVG